MQYIRTCQLVIKHAMNDTDFLSVGNENPIYSDLRLLGGNARYWLQEMVSELFAGNWLEN